MTEIIAEIIRKYALADVDLHRKWIAFGGFAVKVVQYSFWEQFVLFS
jgi:hypothetical protein